jgi:hypothetical protein
MGAPYPAYILLGKETPLLAAWACNKQDQTLTRRKKEKKKKYKNKG